MSAFFSGNELLPILLLLKNKSYQTGRFSVMRNKHEDGEDLPEKDSESCTRSYIVATQGIKT